MKKNYFFLILVFTLIFSGCSFIENANQKDQLADEEINGGQAGLANPASVFCEENGGQIEIMQDKEGNQYGVCFFSNGSYCEEWAFFRGECEIGNQQKDTVNNAEEIKQLFVEKYDKSPDEISIVIGQEYADHIRGGVVFGSGGIGEGGNFLAAKVDGFWRLVFDGNGGISCIEIEPYNFPKEMISDCYN